MVTLDQLRQDLLAARKAKDAVAVGLLNPLVGEAAMVGKNKGNRETTPEETQASVKKFLDGLRETLPLIERRGDADAAVSCRREISILEAYMPAQMTEDELREAVSAFVSANPRTKMGDVMAFLKRDHSGRYDGKAASAVVKQALA